MATIPKMIHRCVVQTGNMAGSKTETEVTGLDIRFGDKCPYCGEPLATLDQVAAYIYKSLTED